MNELDTIVEARIKEAMPQGSGRIVKRGHKCDTPDVDFDEGTVWQCDCGRRFKLNVSPYNRKWEKTLATSLSPRGLIGLGRLLAGALVFVLLAFIVAPALLAVVFGPEYILLYVLHLLVGGVFGAVLDL